MDFFPLPVVLVVDDMDGLGISGGRLEEGFWGRILGDGGGEGRSVLQASQTR